MLFVGTSIIHPSTEGVFLLCNILDLLIYRLDSKESIKYEKIAKIRKNEEIREIKSYHEKKKENYKIHAFAK